MGNKENIKQALKSPNRKVSVRKAIRGLFDVSVPGGKILEETAGSVYLRVERDRDLRTSFIHSAPGTGTRIATVDCVSLEGVEDAFFILKWTTEGVSLRVSDASDTSRFVEGEGKPSEREFMVGRDGKVYELGFEGLDIKEFSIYTKNQIVNQIS